MEQLKDAARKHGKFIASRVGTVASAALVGMGVAAQVADPMGMLIAVACGYGIDWFLSQSF